MSSRVRPGEVRITAEELRELYRQRTARSTAGERDCLSNDAMQKAVEGALGPGERAGLVSHLRRCSDCAREYRVLRALQPWRSALGDAPRSSEGRAARGLGWRLRESIEGWTWAPAAALAAAGALAVLGAWLALVVRENDRTVARLSAEISRLEKELAARPAPLASKAEIAAFRLEAAEALRPQLNVPIVDLDPGVARGVPRPQAPEIRVPRSSSVFALILHVGGERSFSEYLLEIRDARGEVVWTGKGLRPTPENLFTVVLSKLRFRQGEYGLRLYGSARGSRALVETYALKVRSD